MYFVIIWIIDIEQCAVVLWCYAELLIYAVPGSASEAFQKVCWESPGCVGGKVRVSAVHDGLCCMAAAGSTGHWSPIYWRHQAPVSSGLLLPWPPLVTSPDIWLHNWDNNSSGGKHLIKTLCSIWTAELFTQLEGKQGWTMDIERFRVYSVDKYLFALYNIFIIFLDIYYRLI